MQKKNISLVVAGSGEIRDLQIAPGVTVGEALKEAGLQGYQLSRRATDEPLDSGVNLYDLVDNNEKLYATPEDVSVGSSTAPPPGAKLLRTYFDIGAIDLQTRRVVLRRIRRFEVQKNVMVVGKEQEPPYWKQNAWQKIGDTYTGYYKTSYGSWEGLIKVEFTNSYSFFIFDPPGRLKFSKHWQCFTHQGDRKYHIHFSEGPKDVSSGIIAVERLISEAFENHDHGGELWKPRFSDLLPMSWRR